MKESILQKLDNLKDRYEELEGLLSDVEVISNQDKFRTYSMEYSELEPVVNNFQTFMQAQADLDEARLCRKTVILICDRWVMKRQLWLLKK